MKIERMILIAFLGNFLVNNVALPLAALIPGNTGATTPIQQMMSAQYLVYVVLALIIVGILTWWYFVRAPRDNGLMQGLVFGIIGFVVAVATAFITGLSGVLMQTASLTQMLQVLPKFFPYLMTLSTLVLVFIWIIPAVLVGLLMQRRTSAPAAQSMGMGQTM